MTVDKDGFREALSHWPSGVTIVAVREGERVVATTVSSFLSISLEPPLVLVALGPNATVRPYAAAGRRIGISVLGVAHRRLASIFADAYAVGDDPFAAGDPPVVQGALIGMEGTVVETRAGGDHLLAIVSIDQLHRGDGAPLIRYRRRYHELSE